MSVVLAFLVLAVLGALAYGWIRLRQEAHAKINQLLFSRFHREGEGAVGRSHTVVTQSASVTDLLEAAWLAIDVPARDQPPNLWPASIFKSRYPDGRGIRFRSKGRLTVTQWDVALVATDGCELQWKVVNAWQVNGLVLEATSLANLERRVIRALRARDPYCVITTNESKVRWK